MYTNRCARHSRIILFLLALLLLAGIDAGAQKRSGSGSPKAAATQKLGSTPKEHKLLLEGNTFYSKGDVEEALKMYEKALKANPNSAVAAYNAGVASVRRAMAMENPADSVMRQKLVQSASDRFSNVAARRLKKDNISSRAFYNLGNLAFLSEQYGEAISLYKDALRLNPDDNHARRNLRIAQKKQQEQNKNKQPQPQNQNQDNNQDKNQNQQPQPQQINPQTSEQILNAVERKENATRMRGKVKEQPPTERSGSSYKRW